MIPGFSLGLKSCLAALLCLVAMASLAHAGGNDDGKLVLVGNVVRQSAQGTLVAGRLVSIDGHDEPRPILVQARMFWVTGWKETDPTLNQKVRFVVSKSGQSEQLNEVGTKELMDNLRLVRVLD